jgi:two-component system NtrC family response regulator
VITASQSMLGVCGMIERVAPSNLNVLVLGESGTGKEVLARALHSLSPRAGKRFVAINCAAIPETMLEAELFGHEKGAFTGALQKVLGKIEVADRGTLFLDEIGDMPLSLQGKLLRFLQERKIERIGGRVEISVDVRVICATHRAPEDLIKDKLFREDLYYRIKEVEIDVPPLRERIGDPVLLANHFLHVVAAQNGRSLRGFTSEALGAIAAYHWPGNVRELENRIKRAVVMSQGNVLAFGDLDLPQEPVSAPTSLKAVRDVAERHALVQALALANDNISAAAKYLGISRPTMYALMRQHGVRD